MPDFSADPTQAFGEFAETVKSQLSATGEKVDGLAETVKSLTPRIEAVEQRSAAFSEDLDAKFEKLASGDQFAEVAERLKAVETKVERASKFGSQHGEKKSAWADHIESAAFAEYIKGGCKAKDGVRTKAPPIIGRGQGQFAVTIDDSLVGALDRPYDRPGVIELLRDSIGLVDVVNVVPPIGSQTYQYYMETAASETATVGTRLEVAIDGDPTPKTTCTVDNSEGFVPGRPVRFYGASTMTLLATKTLVSKVDSTGVLTFATDDLDFDAAIDDIVTSDEYLATQEGALKPAGFIAAEQKTVDLQTLATWVETTRQRLMYSNHTDLASWINMRLPKRHRENVEWHLLYGDGANDELHGFLHSSILPAGNTDTWSTDMSVGDSRADLVLWSATKIPGDVRTVAVLHKNDWFRILNHKTTGGDYLQQSGQGPTIINTPGLKAIGNVQVVLSRYIVETTGLVFAPEWASEVVPAGDAELWTGFVGEQRIYNKQTHLYEQSLAHAIKDNRAFRKVSFDGAPS